MGGILLDLKKSFIKFMDINAILLIIGIFALLVLFSLLSPYFFTALNFRIIFETAVILAILALGVNFVLIGGEIDLSFAAVFELVAVVIVIGSRYTDIWFVPLILGILAAIGIALINSYFAVKIRIPSFLVTLATMVVVQGAVFILTNYRTIPLRDDIIPLVFHGRYLFGISSSVFWMFGAVILSVVILSKTRFGRNAYATGGHEESARRLGVPTNRVKMLLFIICSLMAALAAMISLSRSLHARPRMGEGYLMPAIAAPVLGGASLLGGRGSTIKTVLGALLLTIMINGFNIIGLAPAYQNIFMGVILISVLSLRIVLAR